MSDEIKETIEKECECKCEFCKAVKKILAIALGTFIGFYCAMSLFFALHRPPMPPCDGFKRPPYSDVQKFEHKKMKNHEKQMPQRQIENDD